MRTLSNEKAGRWTIFLIILLVVAKLISAYVEELKAEEKKRQAEKIEVNSCEEWKSKYSSIPNLEGNYVVRPNRTLILELDSESWSRKIVLSAPTTVYYERNNPFVEILLPGNRVITYKAGDSYPDLREEKPYERRYRGKNCILIKS